MAELNEYSYQFQYGGAIWVFSWERTSFSVADKTSTITWRIAAHLGAWSATTYNYKITVNGTQYTKSHKVPAASNLDVNDVYTFTVKHDVNGRNGSFDVMFNDGVSNVPKTYNVPDVPIPATLTAAPNFNDEANPTITYSNPSGELVDDLEACIEWVGGAQTIKYRDISKTGSTYTFNLTDAERKTLRQGITSGYTRSIRFTIRTQIGSTLYTSTLSRTFSLIEYTPTLSPVIEDINQLSTSLTGDPSVLVRYVSDASFNTNATARKEATLTSGYAINGVQIIDDGISATGIFEAVESNKFQFGVTDSRGYTTTKEIETEWVPYVKPTCSLRIHPLTLAGTLDVTYKGICFTGDFGAKTNSLTFELRVTKNGEPIIPAMPDTRDEYLLDNNGHLQWVTPDGEESGWFPVLFQTPTYGENSYELVFPLDGLDIGSVDNPNTFTIQGIVYDEVTNAQTEKATALSKPIFDWGKTDFQFNVPVYLKDTDIPLENLKDYVVLQGYIDDWFYREWHSGKVELFGTKEIDDIPCNTALGGWYRTAVQTSPTYPFTIFNPIVTVNYESDGFGALVWPTTQSDDTRPFDYYLIRPTSSAGITGKVTYHIIGDHGGQIA